MLTEWQLVRDAFIIKAGFARLTMIQEKADVLSVEKTFFFPHMYPAITKRNIINIC